MTRSEQTWLTDLFSQDVDELVRAAEHLTPAQKVARVKLVATAASSLEDELAQLKALSFIQAALGSLSTRTVPVGTAGTTVDAAAPLTNAKEHAWDVRRAAYNVLALVFLRVRSLTPKLDSDVRAAFRQGKRDPHVSIREFARSAERNVLSQRAASSVNVFNKPIRGAVSVAARTAAFRAYGVVSRAAKRISGGKRTS